MIRRALLVVAALVAAGCGFNRRSTDYTCGPGGECPTGRTCQEGWCVVGGGDSGPPDAYVPPYDGAPDAVQQPDGAPLPDGPPGPDAPPAPDAPPGPDAPPLPDAALPDALTCPPQCTDCLLGTCHIDCTAAGACPTLVTCPAGLPCEVSCGDSACMAGVDCDGASSCVITCGGTGACAGPITCGTSSCRVGCGGATSCTGGLNCSAACRCDTFCTGAGSCSTAPVCPPHPQCDLGTDCTSSPGPCHTC